MFACIHIPDFPVEAIVRGEPLLRARAVAVLEGKAPLTRVVALNEKARLLGMQAGMTKLQASVFATAPAQGKVPQRGTTPSRLAVLRQRSPEQEAAAHAALLDVAHAFSPRVEDAASDTSLLDLAGLERLYGAPAKMGSDLKSQVSAVGLEANVALAASPDAALHAAFGFEGVTLIPAGNEAQRLGILPVQILLDALHISLPPVAGSKASKREREMLCEQMLDTLERWGVRDFRSLALLPEHALASRLGPAGTQLRRLARGDLMRTLHLCAPSVRFEEAMELESPVDAIESLSFVLNRLLEQLCARLETRALAAHALRMQLQLERRISEEEARTQQELNAMPTESHNVAGKPVWERILRLPVPMRDPRVFLKLLQLDLSAHPPGAAVITVWLDAEPAPPRSAQRGLFLPISPELEKLEITLARVKAIVGQHRAGSVRLLDTHRRDSFETQRFAATAQAHQTTTLWDIADEPHLALRLIRPACRLTVQVCDARPAFLSAQGDQRSRLEGKVTWASGPWRASGDWWTENTGGEQAGPWDREEWDVAVGTCNASGKEKDAALYRIYHDVGTGQWFADASYD